VHRWVSGRELVVAEAMTFSGHPEPFALAVMNTSPLAQMPRISGVSICQGQCETDPSGSVAD
jgi:hypothetical protein